MVVLVVVRWYDSCGVEVGSGSGSSGEEEIMTVMVSEGNESVILAKREKRNETIIIKERRLVSFEPFLLVIISSFLH